MKNINEEELAAELDKWFNYTIDKNKFNKKSFMRGNKVLLVLKKHLSMVNRWKRKGTEKPKYENPDKRLNSLNNLILFKKKEKTPDVARDKCENKQLKDSKDVLTETMNQNIDKHNNYKNLTLEEWEKKIPYVSPEEKCLDW